MSAALLARVKGMYACTSPAPFVLFYKTSKLYVWGANAAATILHFERKLKKKPYSTRLLFARIPNTDLDVAPPSITRP